jgi:hypothetical protein
VLSSCSEDFDAWLVIALEQSEQLPGDAGSQAAFGVAWALVLGGAPSHVGADVGVDAQAHQHDGVQGAVELAVTAPVDSLGRLGCQVGLVVWLTMPFGALRLRVGKVASCPASCCDLPCALSAM